MKNQRNNHVGAHVLAICLLAAACAKPSSTTKVPAKVTIPTLAETFQMPSDSIHPAYAELNYPEIVYRFYNSRSFEVAWLSQDAKAMVDSLSLFIKVSRFNGLLPQDYHFAGLQRLKHATRTDSLYRREALLTDAFLSLANDLKYGRLNSGPAFHKDSLLLNALIRVLENKQVRRVLEAQEPVHQQYKALKKSLKRILLETDSLDYNLLCSGVTIDSVALHKKVQLLEINMERWRNEGMKFESRCIWINIPSFQLEVIDNQQTIMTSKIIVGKPDTPTPVISSRIECVTLYPYWYIPRKIAMEEYLPEIQKDTFFLARNNFDVLDRKGNVLDHDTLDWLTYSPKYFPVSLRQREGIENSLGVIKFVFDNPYAVFLHDTNVKSLFNKKVRMFSHGCIRMEKALELAKYLAEDSTIIEAKLSAKERYTINLKKPIHIYIRYFTCDYVDGELNFYDDVYNLDTPIISRLYKNTSRYDQNQAQN